MKKAKKVANWGECDAGSYTTFTEFKSARDYRTMSHEQAYGDAINARTDVYSWGVVRYEMIAGHHPLQTAHTVQRLIAAQISERPVALSTHQTGTPGRLATSPFVHSHVHPTTEPSVPSPV